MSILHNKYLETNNVLIFSANYKFLNSNIRDDLAELREYFTFCKLNYLWVIGQYKLLDDFIPPIISCTKYFPIYMIAWRQRSNLWNFRDDKTNIRSESRCNKVDNISHQLSIMIIMGSLNDFKTFVCRFEFYSKSLLEGCEFWN